MSSTVQYIIRESQRSELSFIMAMMKDYLSEETIYQSFLKKNSTKFSEEQLTSLKKYAYDYVLELVNNHPSLIVIHVPSQKIVGHLILAIIENPLLETKRPSSPVIPDVPIQSPEAVDALLKYLEQFMALRETFAKYPYAEMLVRTSLLGVDREHRGKGLSKSLLKSGVQWISGNGYKLAQGTFSSAISQRAARSVGFRSLYDFDLRNCRNEEGETIFADAGANNVISTMTLILS